VGKLPVRLALAFATFALAETASPAGAPQWRTPPRAVAAQTGRSVTEDLSRGATFRFQIAANLPEFRFVVVPDRKPPDQWGNAQSTVEDVEVFRGDSNQPFQHLTGCDWSATEPPPAGYNWFRAEDFNFDGYRDIYLLRSWGATGNEYGCVWLYNPAAGRFEYSEEFSHLARSWLDPANKTILTFETFGMAGAIHRARRFKVENNRLVPIWTEDQELDRTKNQLHCVIQERRGASLATIQDAWVSPDAQHGPCDPATFIPRSPQRAP
jgi:hypothetical protein